MEFFVRTKKRSKSINISSKRGLKIRKKNLKHVIRSKGYFQIYLRNEEIQLIL